MAVLADAEVKVVVLEGGDELAARWRSGVVESEAKGSAGDERTPTQATSVPMPLSTGIIC